MQPALAFALLLMSTSACFAQDAELRDRAVALLERAHAASIPPNLPNLERVDTFSVFNPDAQAREGSFSRVVIQGTGRREEITFGNYHVTHVWTGNTLATSEGTTTLIPPEVVTVMRLTPILLLRFDDSDVIRAIADRQIERRSLHCIEFDTIRGQQTQNNEICVDAANGTVVSQRLGNDIIENTNFFTFAGALYPAKITYSVLNRGPQLEIAQTVTELPPETTNVLTAPPDARMHYLCTTYRRAIGQSTPQPRPGNRNGGADIAVRAMIGVDGKVHDPLVQSSERPDLNAEALSLVSQWVFLPAMCNGRPNLTEATLILHFEGR